MGACSRARTMALAMAPAWRSSPYWVRMRRSSPGATGSPPSRRSRHPPGPSACPRGIGLVGKPRSRVIQLGEEPPRSKKHAVHLAHPCLVQQGVQVSEVPMEEGDLSSPRGQTGRPLLQGLTVPGRCTAVSRSEPFGNLFRVAARPRVPSHKSRPAEWPTPGYIPPEGQDGGYILHTLVLTLLRGPFALRKRIKIRMRIRWFSPGPAHFSGGPEQNRCATDGCNLTFIIDSFPVKSNCFLGWAGFSPF